MTRPIASHEDANAYLPTEYEIELEKRPMRDAKRAKGEGRIPRETGRIREYAVSMARGKVFFEGVG